MPTGGIRARTSGIMVPAFVAPSGFTPASLSNLIFWYKADKDVYSDLSGTTPATDGGEVQLWKNQASTGSTYDLKGGVATFGNAGMTYHASGLNGLPTLENDGGKTLATNTNPISLGGQLISVFMVFKLDIGGVNRLLSVCNGTSDTAADAFLIYPNGSSTTPTTFNVANVASQTVVAGSWNNLGTIFDSVNNTMYVAGVAGTPVASSPTFNASVNLGVTCRGGDASAQIVGFVAEVIGQKVVSSAGEIANIQTYFHGRWGV